MSAESSAAAIELVPVRLTIHLTAAVPLSDWLGGARVWDEIDDALAALPHVFGEGGGGELMEPADLIVDSPLDRYIKARAKEGRR